MGIIYFYTNKINNMKKAQQNRSWNTKPEGSKTVAGMHWKKKIRV